VDFIGGCRIFLEGGVTLGTQASDASEHYGVWAYGRMKFEIIITERNFVVQWRRQDLARGGPQSDIEIT